MVWDDLKTLPDHALQTTREFILFQKRRHGIEQPRRPTREARIAAYERLMAFKGTPGPEIDCKKELMEALDEKYNRSL